ncbi:MAG: DUF4157 domain-containing protein [Bacteroidota bacterium]
MDKQNPKQPYTEQLSEKITTQEGGYVPQGPVKSAARHAALQKKADHSSRNRHIAALQRKADAKQSAVIQRQKNGLPSDLQAGIESLSGMSMNNVRVHYNSSKPAQYGAHAYAKGSDIHLGAGQEKHLPHEAWHTVQQNQGRVKATGSIAGQAINDNKSLEHEADVMGKKAITVGAEKIAQGKFSEDG